MIDYIFKFSSISNSKNKKAIDDIKNQIKVISENFSFNSNEDAHDSKVKRTVIGKMSGGITKPHLAFNFVKDNGGKTTSEEAETFFKKKGKIFDVPSALSTAKKEGLLDQATRGGTWFLTKKGKEQQKFKTQGEG